MQRTALRAREIVAFLKVGIGPNAFPIYGCAAADAQAVGRALCRRLARSPTVVSGVYTLERRAVPQERIERGMEARGAERDSRQCIRTPTHTKARDAGCGSGQRDSANRRCSCRLGSW